jgi:hypothetical protein
LNVAETVTVTGVDDALTTAMFAYTIDRAIRSDITTTGQRQ